jgi:phosphatidylserine decarboxylase
MKNKLKILIQYLLPHHALSNMMGWFGNCRWPLLKDNLIAWFIKRYQVDLSEAVQPNAKNYISFNDFFTRALKPDARHIVTEENTIACPVDGFVSQVGQINHGQLFQAKNKQFSLLQLLGGNQSYTSLFTQGQFATLYLAPKNYHRVHIPLAGQLKEMVYVPGKLFSVSPLTVENVDNLFARNERLITLFDTKIGPMAVIFVGAMIVASIETVWAGSITPPHGKTLKHWDYSHQIIKYESGDEIGRFKMGSTVIVLFPQNRVTFPTHLQPQIAVKMGELLGSLCCHPEHREGSPLSGSNGDPSLHSG